MSARTADAEGNARAFLLATADVLEGVMSEARKHYLALQRTPQWRAADQKHETADRERDDEQMQQAHLVPAYWMTSSFDASLDFELSDIVKQIRFSANATAASLRREHLADQRESVRSARADKKAKVRRDAKAKARLDAAVERVDSTRQRMMTLLEATGDSRLMRALERYLRASGALYDLAYPPGRAARRKQTPARRAA